MLARYEGGFDAGIFDGKGRYHCAAEGTVFDGMYAQGKRQGRGRLVSTLGNVFDG
jgi:hypothetical protein